MNSKISVMGHMAGSNRAMAGRGVAPAGAGRPPGTATRLTTGMAGNRPQAGATLTAQLNISDRPMTQQGLGGMKTAGPRGPQRQVQDKTYFMGLLRSKAAELQQEINVLREETKHAEEDQATFLSYEKRAEALTSEIKLLQNELGDYNTLVDKLTTDESIADIQMDYEDLKRHNDNDAKTLDRLFDQRQQRENVVRDIDFELQQEKAMADSMIGNMDPKMRQHFLEMQHRNDVLLRQLEAGQQQLDSLHQTQRELEEELAASPLKQEATKLYSQLGTLEDKRNQLVEDMKMHGSPQEEREMLLKQVKEDNLEIATMERQIHELKERMANMGEEMNQLNMDIEESQGERNQKYKELKKREETMDEFMNSYEENHAHELQHIDQQQKNIVESLENMSRNLKRLDEMAPQEKAASSAGSSRHSVRQSSQAKMPSARELSNMKEDLVAKEEEMGKSQDTMHGLGAEHEKLHQDLMKVEQLESKITTELSMLKERIDKMSSELVLYDDLENLRINGEKKKKELHEAKIILHLRRRNFKLLTSRMNNEYESMKKGLGENETHAQLGNLEVKWQHHEQNNYVMKEFIASKMMECDYERVAKKIYTAIDMVNNDLMTKCQVKKQQQHF